MIKFLTLIHLDFPPTGGLKFDICYLTLSTSMIIFPKTVHTIPELCRLLAVGQVIAAPTETAYGLLADALNFKAVRAVQKIKGRELGKPIALIAGSVAQVKKYFFVTALNKKLINKFWPGALTLLLKPRVKFPSSVVGLNDYVGVRVSKSIWLRQVCLSLGRPITATSANLAGQPTIFDVKLVIKNLTSHGLKYVVDGGRLKSQSVSTVALVSHGQINVLSEGIVSKIKLQNTIKP